MTTYTVLSDAELAQDKPITQAKMRALRDNPIAITEGASGAPQIQTAAIADGAITAAKLASGATNLVLLSETSITATSTFAITLNTTYSHFFVDIDGLVAGSGATTLYLKFGHSGGSTILTSGYGYNYYAIGSAESANSAQANIQMGTLLSSTASEKFSSSINVVCNAYGATIDATNAWTDNGGAEKGCKVIGNNANAPNTIDTLQLSLSSGSFTATGTVRVYGVAK